MTHHGQFSIFFFCGEKKKIFLRKDSSDVKWSHSPAIDNTSLLEKIIFIFILEITWMEIPTREKARLVN